MLFVVINCYSCFPFSFFFFFGGGGGGGGGGGAEEVFHPKYKYFKSAPSWWKYQMTMQRQTD